MTYKIFDRVILQSDLKNNHHDDNSEITPAGTILTIVTEPKGTENEILILRKGTENERPIIIGAAVSLLRKVTQDELDNDVLHDYRDLTSHKFWIGQKYKVGYGTSFEGIKSGAVGKIVSAKLAENEMNDMLYLRFGNSKEYSFERNFVEKCFDFYDEEVEKMMGEEINFSDQPRNYHIPGARMIYQNKEFVIINKVIESEDEKNYEVETLNHENLIVKKKDLTPIINAEQLFQYKEEELVQKNYRTNSVLRAKESISKHALLNKSIKLNDIIEILHVDCFNIDVNDDIYQIVINAKFDKPITVSYRDLKNHFEHLIVTAGDAKELDEFDINAEFDVFINNDQTDEIQGHVENSLETESTNLQIEFHELSILGYRFKIENNEFILNGHSYTFNEIDNLVKALNEIKKFGK